MKVKCNKCGEERSFGDKGLNQRVEKLGISMDKFKEQFECKYCKKGVAKQPRQPRQPGQIKQPKIKAEKKKKNDTYKCGNCEKEMKIGTVCKDCYPETAKY